MKVEDLPKSLQEIFTNMKHYSNTLQNDVNDALLNADSLREFSERIDFSIDMIIYEANSLKKIFEKAFWKLNKELCAKKTTDKGSSPRLSRGPK